MYNLSPLRPKFFGQIAAKLFQLSFKAVHPVINSAIKITNKPLQFGINSFKSSLQSLKREREQAEAADDQGGQGSKGWKIVHSN